MLEEVMRRHSPYIRITFLALCLAFTIFSLGCASSGGKSYTPGEARKAQTVEKGSILALEEVTIEQDSTMIGPTIGGVAGGAAGSTIGGGKGRILGAVGGALAGAAAGALAEKAIRSEKAYEFTIELENGRTISVVQAIDDDYVVGDKVRVITGAGNKVRVVRAP